MFPGLPNLVALGAFSPVHPPDPNCILGLIPIKETLMPYTLPPLPYPTDALEPNYDKATLEIHHGKHHAAYVEKLNKAIAEIPAFAVKTIEEILSDLDAIPHGVRQAVINNGGGHANHSLFWRVMGPGKGGEPTGKVAEAIRKDFKSFQDFRRQFTTAAMELFGSGWTFLVEDSEGRLRIQNLPNQDSPVSQRLKPILLLDLWEHAYYLKWQNRKADWIESWWNLVNWDEVNVICAEEPAWMMANAD
jgi:superoxide dismutase, Fe-Mn family